MEKVYDAWKQVMALRNKETRKKGIANTLRDDELTTMIGTAEFFGCSNGFLGMMVFDLKTARYRLFDWIAMLVQGRHGNQPNAMLTTKVFAHSFLKCEGDVDKFIEDLRETDYQCDGSYERIVLQEA